MERYLRLIPLYIFMIFFLWKFISLFGGAGPRFYEFETGHGCSVYWVYHFFMLNNIAPWEDKDYCIEESWYIANDFWFMVVGLIMIEKYRTNRKYFCIYSFLLSLFCIIVQTISIYQNSFSASYLTYSDEYWTIYYKKPFCHFHSYNIGMIVGCVYFSYKYQEDENQRLRKYITKIKTDPMAGGLCVFIGLLVQIIIMNIN